MQLLHLPFILLTISGTRQMPTWLIGTWTCDSKTQSTSETWSLEGQVLRGTSQTVRDGNVVFTESLLIHCNDCGKLVYVAQPMNQPDTSFTEVQAQEDFVAFENPDHDFPRRITYRLLDQHTLVAEISEKIGGGGKSMKWTYKRAS